MAHFTNIAVSLNIVQKGGGRGGQAQIKKEVQNS